MSTCCKAAFLFHPSALRIAGLTWLAFLSLAVEISIAQSDVPHKSDGAHKPQDPHKGNGDLHRQVGPAGRADLAGALDRHPGLPEGFPDARRFIRVAVDGDGGGDATLAPCGTRFLATSRRSGNWDVWMYDIPTEQWTQVTNDPADDFEGRFSPDGKSIVFCSTRTGQKDIWVLESQTQKLTRLTDSEDDDEYPAWSPDGKFVVYTGGPWRNRHLYQIAAAGGKPQQLTGAASFLGAGMYAPDGESLVCHRYDFGSGDLFRLGRASGMTQILTAGPAWDYKPAPAPDGKTIAFSRSEDGPSHIWLMSSDGRSAVKITDSPWEDRWPTWSASGRSLLFHRIVEKGQGIKLLNLTTREISTIVPGEELPLYGSLDRMAARVVYSCQAGDRKRLRIRNIATGEIQTADTGPGDAHFPKWSPKGDKIAFVATEGLRWDVCVMNGDGSDHTVLTTSASHLRGMDGPLDWSPDGSRIVFHADTRPFEANLFMVNVANKQVTQVTGGAFFDESPSWTPDGRGVAFMSTRGGNWSWGIYCVNVDDGSIRQLIKPDWVEKNHPHVSPDNGLVMSRYDESGKQRLIHSTADGALRDIPEAGNGVYWPSFSGDYRHVVFSRVDRSIEYCMANDLSLDRSVGVNIGQSRSTHSLDERCEIVCDRVTETPAQLNLLVRSPVHLHHR